MASILYPEVEAGALDTFLHLRAPEAAKRKAWTADDGPMPTIYLSHGAPPLFNDRHWIDQLFGWASSLPKPTGILILSAHWESAPIMLSSAEAGHPLVYDFAGFARRYYAMTYPTPDAGWLVRATASMLPSAEQTHQADRGLDHGAWVPLKVMYPQADVPVLQLSLPTQEPHRLMDLGRRLRPLRDQGVLIIGSGYLTHGLPYLTRAMFERNEVAGWSADFDAWTAAALADVDWDELTRYREAPGMPFAHPTVEHFTPLFVTLGAATAPAVPTTVIDDFQMGLAKRSIQLA